MAIDNQNKSGSDYSSGFSSGISSGDSLAKGAQSAGAGLSSSSSVSSPSSSSQSSAGSSSMGSSSSSMGSRAGSPGSSASSIDSGAGAQHALQSQGDAFDTLRTSVVGVLDSVVREYEPQIAQFTSSIAHQAVDRGVEFGKTAVQRVKSQSWMRIGLAAALGLGIVAVLGYEAEQAATADSSDRSRKNIH